MLGTSKPELRDMPIIELYAEMRAHGTHNIPLIGKLYEFIILQKRAIEFYEQETGVSFDKVERHVIKKNGFIENKRKQIADKVRNRINGKYNAAKV